MRDTIDLYLELRAILFDASIPAHNRIQECKELILEFELEQE